MRFGMIGMAVMLTAASAGMAHGELENGKSWSTPYYSAPHYGQVIIADANQALLSADGKIKKLGVCHLVPMIEDVPPSTGEAGYYVFGLGDDAFVYLDNYEHRVVRGAIAAVTLLQKPEHGVLVDRKGGRFAYFPNAGYLGKDKAIFEVEYAGEKFHIVYFFRSIEGGTDGMEEKYCPKGASFWKISSTYAAPVQGENGDRLS